MMTRMEPIPVELFLSAYPEPMQAIAQRLRAVVRRATPDAVEAVRAGWHLIGYDLPVGRRTTYFCYIAPEPAHVHLGFEYGTFMDDPEARRRSGSRASSTGRSHRRDTLGDTGRPDDPAMKTSTPPPPAPATVVECPWCDGAVELPAEATALDCPDCRIRVDLAPTTIPTARLAAAA
jgi:hypothetical protein